MKTENSPAGGLTRLRYLFSPWWRVAWLIGGIVWLIVFNAIYIASEVRNEWLGFASVIPIMALLIDVFVRDYRRRRMEHQQGN